MQNGKIISRFLVVAAIAVMALLALYVRIGATADTVAVFRTDGMTCASCATKIRTALEREKGVAATEVDLAGGRVIVGFDSTKTSAAQLAERVTAAGFNSVPQAQLSPEQFRKMTGRDVGKSDAQCRVCCGGKGGCSADRQKN